MWKPQASFEGNDISGMGIFGNYGKRGGAISIKILHANAISGGGGYRDRDYESNRVMETRSKLLEEHIRRGHRPIAFVKILTFIKPP